MIVQVQFMTSGLQKAFWGVTLLTLLPRARRLVWLCL
jgi:hypothetical protein